MMSFSTGEVSSTWNVRGEREGERGEDSAPGSDAHERRRYRSTTLARMDVHLVDGTYELFRQHFGRPEPGPYGAAIGVLELDSGPVRGRRHTCRRGLRPRHRVVPQRPVAGLQDERRDAARAARPAAGVRGRARRDGRDRVADDRVRGGRRDGCSGRDRSSGRARHQVFLCTPDKDLGQCVVGTRVVQLDRRKGLVIDEDGVRGEVRRGPSVDPRLPRARRRQRRRLPGAAWVRARRPHRLCSRGTSISTRSRPSPPSGTCPGCATCRGLPRRWPRTSTSRCSFAGSRPSNTTSTSARWTAGGGAARPPLRGRVRGARNEEPRCSGGARHEGPVARYRRRACACTTV